MRPRRALALALPLLALAACGEGQGGGGNLLAGLGLPAAPPPRPAGVSDADIAAFRAAVEEAGCRVTNAEEAALVEARTGLDAERLRGVVEYLAGQGEMADAPDTGFVLRSGGCAA